MNEPSKTAAVVFSEQAQASFDLAEELAAARAEIARLTAEYQDLTLLYEATIEHGEAVEDQLADSNLALQRTQARLEAELLDAARYVMSILPAQREAFPSTEWSLVPSTELGGDSFGYHDIDEDHMAFYLLDVCGHGVGAALLSVAAIKVLQSSALPATDFREPHSVLCALNEAFPMEKQNDMFFTIWYGVYQRTTATLVYASGGHPPAIHLRAGADRRTTSTHLMTRGGMAIGALPDTSYQSERIVIEPGDRLLLISDGTFEVSGPNGDMLGIDDLTKFVTMQSDYPQAVLDWVRSFNADGPLPDDFSLLRVQF
ncbi:MAG: PP2C family protein-serine/threonine phosphatase [Rhizobiaceae bacterium]